MPSLLSNLCIGIALGGAATWWSLVGTSGGASATAHSREGSSLDSAASSPLPVASAADAIASWFAWRAPQGLAPSYAAQVDRLRALLLRLPPESLPGLLDRLSGSGSPADARLRRIAFTACVEKSPPLAARWALARPGGDDGLKLAREATDAWAALDPRAASDWACALPDEKTARDLAGRALARLAAQDPAAALALASSRDAAFSKDVLSELVSTLGAKDPAGTLRTFGPALWDNGKGCFTLLDTIETWARKDPAAAAAWLLAQPRSSSRTLTNCLVNIHHAGPAWHQAIADGLLAQPALPDRSRLVAESLSTWRRSNAADALAWLKAVRDPDLRLRLVEETIQSSSEQPGQDLAFVVLLPEGALRDEQIGQQLACWARQSPDDALAWMRAHESLPGVAESSASVHGALLGELAREDPRRALDEWAKLADPKARRAAASAIAAEWGKTDPAAAFQWSSGEREKAGDSGSLASPALLSDWAKRDPSAALRWVEDWSARQPETARAFGLTYLAALGGTANDVTARAATADLYTQIRDAELRVRALKFHVARWLAKDPAAARAWVEASPALTTDQRAQILAPAKP